MRFGSSYRSSRSAPCLGSSRPSRSVPCPFPGADAPTCGRRAIRFCARRARARRQREESEQKGTAAEAAVPGYEREAIGLEDYLSDQTNFARPLEGIGATVLRIPRARRSTRRRSTAGGTNRLRIEALEEPQIGGVTAEQLAGRITHPQVFGRVRVNDIHR